MKSPPRTLVSIGAYLVLTLHAAGAAAAPPTDPELFAALRADPQLNAVCDCVVAAGWLDQSYARVVIDRKRWKKLGLAARERFSARALRVAEATYLAEFAATDQYEEIFIVDERGKPLSRYEGKR